MEHCRLQIGCLLIVVYIAFTYFRESKRYQKNQRNRLFEDILRGSIFFVLFDGVTAVTVNYLDVVPVLLNKIFHWLFLSGLVTQVYLLYIYMLKSTGGYPRKKAKRIAMKFPYFLIMIAIISTMGTLEYRAGKYTNYSMGFPVYICFGSVGIYVAMTVVECIKKWHYIESHKRISIITYLCTMASVAVVQAIFPELLLTSIVAAVMVVGVYVNQENPINKEVSRYHNEMVMSFATLVENKDGSTGGHVKRTTSYVALLAEELRNRGYYTEILTKDYINNLCQSAPMHDIGKVAVPDQILQKPGKLTDEEFDIIKKHTTDGGRIVEETFGNLGNDDYTDMAYRVAKYHHEKWNGRGYPEGLKEDEIPLCARIMAVADVFDAVSEKRCYRDAMEMDQCFAIISEGVGRDFDPIIAQVFIDCREKVERIHNGQEPETKRLWK